VAKHKFKVGDRVYRRSDVGGLNPVPSKVGGMVGEVTRLAKIHSPRHPTQVRVRWLPRGNESRVEERALVLVNVAIEAGIPGSNPDHEVS
jgi:hypothetical protein